MSQISKTIAVSTLGLYAGILSTSTLVKIASPKDIVSSEIKHIYCILGIGSSIIGGLTTGAFAISYLLSTRCCCSTYLLYGLLVAPVTGGYLWTVDKLKNKLSFMNKTDSKKDDTADKNTEATASKVELPPSHPPIVNESGEKLACPFANGKAKSTKHSACHTKNVANKVCGTVICQLHRAVKDITPHFIIVSVASITAFSTIIHKHFK